MVKGFTLSSERVLDEVLHSSAVGSLLKRALPLTHMMYINARTPFEVLQRLTYSNPAVYDFISEEFDVIEGAVRDSLTNAYERRRWFEDLDQMLSSPPIQLYRGIHQYRSLDQLADSKRNQIYVAILDGDKFKDFNDQYNHDTGNLIMCAISNSVAQEVMNINHRARQLNLPFIMSGPYRTGIGDEFAFMVQGKIDSRTMMELAARMKDDVQRNVPSQVDELTQENQTGNVKISSKFSRVKSLWTHRPATDNADGQTRYDTLLDRVSKITFTAGICGYDNGYLHDGALHTISQRIIDNAEEAVNRAKMARGSIVYVDHQIVD